MRAVTVVCMHIICDFQECKVDYSSIKKRVTLDRI